MKGSLSLQDLLSADTLDKSQIQETDGLLMLRAADTISIEGNDLFWIVDRTNSLEYSLSNSTISKFNSSGQYNVNEQCSLGFYGVNYPTIVSGKISSGSLKASVTTNMNHSGTITISAPYFTFDDDTASLTIDLEPTGNTQKTISKSLSLGESTWTYPDFGSKINTNSKVKFVNSGNQTNEGDFIRIEISMVNVVYGNLVGELANQRADRIERIPLGFLKELNGDIEFEDPRVNIYMSSSFGTIIGVDVQDIYTFKKGNEANKRQFGGPPKNGTKLFEPTSSTKYFNTLNLAFTNATAQFIGGAGGVPSGADPYKVMSYVLNNAPDSLRAHYIIRSNPFWEPEIGEYYNGSQVNLITEVLLPLKGSAEMYLLDTFDYNFLSEKDAESIEYVILKLIVGNSLPVYANISIDVYDQNPWNGGLIKLLNLSQRMVILN